MKPTPPGWPRISAAVYYDDAVAAIDWLVGAFGFEVRLKILGNGGHVEHSELTYGDAVVMVGQAGAPGKPAHRKSPRALGGANTQAMMVYVDDVEAHCVRARAAGAKIVAEPATTDYGEDYWTDRGYECEDPEGHHWWFYQRLRSPKAKGDA
jgi:uncharacterized glyoxalase superfamily protein PhnB